MKNILRIPRKIWLEILADQKRKHSFAYERVGYLAARSTTLASGGALLLGFHYLPVKDEHYIEDHSVGARISSDAIRAGMQLALDETASVFHVHQHPHRGLPKPSSTDMREYTKMLPPLCNVRPHMIHGALITSLDSGSAFYWDVQKSVLRPLAEVTVVGSQIEKFFQEV